VVKVKDSISGANATCMYSLKYPARNYKIFHGTKRGDQKSWELAKTDFSPQPSYVSIKNLWAMHHNNGTWKI